MFHPQYTFSPTGMTEEELLFHAGYQRKYNPNSFRDSEVYGCGKFLRKYGFYPSFLPLRLHVAHGPSQWDVVQHHMITSGADYTGFYSKRLVDDFRSKSSKKSFVVYSPFVFYRRKQAISPASNSQGAIFFHSHSTYWMDKATNIDKTVEVLDQLPDHFKPYAVCLHFVDIEKGEHKTYLERGIPVYTAGNWLHPFFTENFYEIMRHFRHTLSVTVGSQLLFSAEMGIPHSLIPAPKPVIVSHNDPNVEKLGKDAYNHAQIELVSNLFNGLHEEITLEQSTLVRQELGIDKGISRPKMAFYLYLSLIRWLVRLPLQKGSWRYFLRFPKRVLSKSYRMLSSILPGQAES